MSSRAKARAAIVLAAALAACEPPDGDGWYDTADNQRVIPRVHFLVMAERAARQGEQLYGIANRPGYNLIVGSKLGVLGADGMDYQAKTVMHELGHNLNLCHPLQTGNGCAVLPAAEMDPAVSVMGSPAEAANLVLIATQAMSRPLDYSPTQWSSLQF